MNAEEMQNEAVHNAVTSAHFYMMQAHRKIDAEFGKGYASKHPSLVGAFMQTCAADYSAWSRANVAQAIDDVAMRLKFLGNGDAATNHGAIEAYGMHMGEKVDSLTDAIGSIATAISEVASELEHSREEV